MITINKKQKEITSERKSSYGILTNKKGEIATVRHKDWGLIFPGGKIEEKETSEQTIKRETLEEIGYDVEKLEYYETTESYYDITTTKGKNYYCHNIADFYTGIITNKIQEPIETDTSLEWYSPEEIFGKMKLDFQNIILKKLYYEKEK